MDPNLAVTLRAKKLGILIRDARLASGKSLEECEKALGATGGKISSFEKGDNSPSLPEMELLSHFLNVPISRFWKDEITSTDPTFIDYKNIENTLIQRDHYVGKILKQNRTEGKFSYKDISEKTGITPSKFKKYEGGEIPIPLPELEIVCNFMGNDITSYFDHDSLIGNWIISQNNVEAFLKLPLNLQYFVSKPINRPYLEIAQRLSNLSAEELRTIAEGLLEITI